MKKYNEYKKTNDNKKKKKCNKCNASRHRWNKSDFEFRFLEFNIVYIKVRKLLLFLYECVYSVYCFVS